MSDWPHKVPEPEWLPDTIVDLPIAINNKNEALQAVLNALNSKTDDGSEWQGVKEIVEAALKPIVVAPAKTTFSLTMRSNDYWIYADDSASPDFHKRLTWPTLTAALEWAWSKNWHRDQISVVELSTVIVKKYR